jgi:4-coumarate--CoA ligase
MVTSDDEKYILYGGPDPDNIGDGCRSIGEFLLKQLLRNGDTVALIDGVTGESTTYLQLRSQAIRLARVFQAKGVKINDVIGIVSENRIEFPVTMIAAFLCGAKVAPFNRTYTERKYRGVGSFSQDNLCYHLADKLKFQIKILPTISRFITRRKKINL